MLSLRRSGEKFHRVVTDLTANILFREKTLSDHIMHVLYNCIFLPEAKEKAAMRYNNRSVFPHLSALAGMLIHRHVLIHLPRTMRFGLLLHCQLYLRPIYDR